MRRIGSILIEEIPGFYCVINSTDQTIHIYYKDKKEIKNLLTIMDVLAAKSELSHLELACFNFFIEQQDELITNIKTA